MDKITVIMSTYNGSRFLDEQIESILHQDGVDLHLVIRDDGSTDTTPEIIKKYKDSYPCIDNLIDKNVGCKKSFYLCAKHAFDKNKDCEYFAFSDQDDYWMPDKLISGIESIKKESYNNPNLPYLYFCAPKIVDGNLAPLDIHWNSNHFLNFEEACMAQPCAGCTMIFNRKALELFLLGNPDEMSMHDSWLYKTVLACGGKIIEDATPHMLYRQHGNNVIGTGSFSGRWKRRFENFTGKSKYRSGQVRGILKTYRKHMPEDIINVAETLSGYQENGIINKLRIIADKRFRTRNKMHNSLFKIAILFNRY